MSEETLKEAKLIENNLFISYYEREFTIPYIMENYYFIWGLALDKYPEHPEKSFIKLVFTCNLSKDSKVSFTKNLIEFENEKSELSLIKMKEYLLDEDKEFSYEEIKIISEKFNVKLKYPDFEIILPKLNFRNLAKRYQFHEQIVREMEEKKICIRKD